MKKKAFNFLSCLWIFVFTQLQVVKAQAINLATENYVTPEMFGCSCAPDINPSVNADNMQRAINVAIKEGKKLISSGGKVYPIGKELLIDGPIEMDLGKAVLVAMDSINIIHIAIKPSLQWYGLITGFTIDMNNIAKSGILVESAIKMHFCDGEIRNVSKNGTAITIESGYELFFNRIHITAGSNYATGIKISTSDCHFSDCVMINCNTAINNYGSNVYNRIHAWMGDRGKWLSGSVFFLSRGGESYLNQCCSDTFYTSFKITSSSLLFVNQQKNLHNKKMWEEKNFFPYFFYFDPKAVGNSKVYMTCSRIGGLSKNGKNIQHFTNNDNTEIEIIGCSIAP